MSENLEIPEIKNPVHPIELKIFKEHIKRGLLTILDSLPQTKKTLILDKSCISSINYLSDVKTLNSKGIEKGMLILRDEPFEIDTKVLVYIIPAVVDSLVQINNQINLNLSKSGIADEKEYHIIVIPKLNVECQNYLNNNQNKHYFKIHNLNLDIFILDYDLMSLEQPFIYKDLYINKNLNILSTMARTILKYEAVFGKIKYKYYKGNNSKKMIEILEEEEAITSINEKNSTLACMVFERDTDWITPFVTQFTYEGMLDENFNINFNVIKVKPSILEKDSKGDVIKVDLSSKDKFYYMIKDYNFNKIRLFLSNRLQTHTQVIAEGKGTTKFEDLEKSLKKVKLIKEERQSLTNQINLADYLAQQQRSPYYKNYLKYEQSLLIGGDLPPNLHDFYIDEISKKEEMFKILRLMCIESLTHCGIYYKFYDQLKKFFLTVYGHQNIFLWRDLEELNILHKESKEYPYDFLCNKFNLICEYVNINEPNDPAYAYGGYCPLNIRLIEAITKKGWKNIKDLIKRIPGEFDFPQDESEILKEDSENKIVLLVFLGGITYGEIAAIRFLNTVSNKKFVILTSGIIHSKRIIDDLIDNHKIENKYSMKEYASQILKKSDS
ncbi:MAG: Sec1 family protein [archaeon]|nr:Sec1 family protein [archaeon]